MRALTGKLNHRVPQSLIDEMRKTARERGTAQGSVLEAAMRMYFSETEHEAVLDRRLNKLQKQIERLTKEQQLTLETLACFIQLYLAHTPEIPLERKEEMEENVAERLDKVVNKITRAVSRKTLFRNLIDEKILSEIDFEALH